MSHVGPGAAAATFGLLACLLPVTILDKVGAGLRDWPCRELPDQAWAGANRAAMLWV